jgi:hypothetical protein
MSTALSRPAPALRRRQVVLLLAVLLAIGLGAWRAVQVTRPESAPASADALRLDGVTYTVAHVEQVSGLTDEDLSGMSHGIQGLVSSDKALLRVSMTVRSGSSARIYDPSVLTVLDDAGGKPIAPAGGSLSQGGIGPRAQVEGSLAFIVPRNGHHYRLHAPNIANSVDLISVDVAAPTTPAHDHAAGPSANSTQSPTTKSAGPLSDLGNREASHDHA